MRQHSREPKTGNLHWRDLLSGKTLGVLESVNAKIIEKESCYVAILTDGRRFLINWSSFDNRRACDYLSQRAAKDRRLARLAKKGKS